MSYNFRHRFTAETVDQIFAWILNEIAEAGYLSLKAVFIDGTHIKANANTKKAIKEQKPVASRHYAQELMEEVNADREAHGKKPFEGDNKNEPPAAPRKRKDNTSKKKQARRKKEKTRTVTSSVTDPDCGLFVKGDHKRQFAYEAHTACDKHGFVLETVVMENTLVLTTEPFAGFMPEDLRTWLKSHCDDTNLATALAGVHNHTGCLGHELVEGDDQWLTYAFKEWWSLEKELYEMVTDSMRQANLCGKANYDLEQNGLYYLVKPFMEKNGYRDGSGWWIKAAE